MVNNLVFRWPKPVFFMVLGAHGNCLAGFQPLTSNTSRGSLSDGITTTSCLRAVDLAIVLTGWEGNSALGN